MVRQATLLAVGISQAQAFVDGNKRTAYSAAETFLLLNKHRLTGASIELARHFELIAEEFGDREEAVERFEAWLRGPVVPRPG